METGLRGNLQDLGNGYCAGNKNYDGLPGQLGALGSINVGANDLTFYDFDLAAGRFGYLLMSR